MDAHVAHHSSSGRVPPSIARRALIIVLGSSLAASPTAGQAPRLEGVEAPSTRIAFDSPQAQPKVPVGFAERALLTGGGALAGFTVGRYVSSHLGRSPDIASPYFGALAGSYVLGALTCVAIGCPVPNALTGAGLGLLAGVAAASVVGPASDGAYVATYAVAFGFTTALIGGAKPREEAGR